MKIHANAPASTTTLLHSGETGAAQNPGSAPVIWSGSFLQKPRIAYGKKMSPPSTHPRLLIPQDDGTTRERVLKGETVIGRSTDCDVVLDEVSVSRRHALLRPEADGSWTLMDLGSANRTFCRDDPVRLPITLRDGDQLKFGDFKVEFRWATSEYGV